MYTIVQGIIYSLCFIHTRTNLVFSANTTFECPLTNDNNKYKVLPGGSKAIRITSGSYHSIEFSLCRPVIEYLFEWYFPKLSNWAQTVNKRVRQFLDIIGTQIISNLKCLWYFCSPVVDNYIVIYTIAL